MDDKAINVCSRRLVDAAVAGSKLQQLLRSTTGDILP